MMDAKILKGMHYVIVACDPCLEIARLPMLQQQEAFQSDGNQSA